MANKQLQSFTKFLDESLNVEQKKAVIHKAGSQLVIAGAGSGKTRVITARIAYLILHEHVHPSSIIALTFTNKAAKEMQERIAHFLGSGTNLPFVGTFHAYCLRLLKKNNALLDTPFLSMLDEDDQLKIISGIIERAHAGKKITAKQLLYQISHYKNQSVNPTLAAFDNKMFSEMYAAYEAEKRVSKCFDFDDLLLETLKLFKKSEHFKTTFHDTIRHILVDEYQDTNVVQHELLKQMACQGKKLVIDSLCAVGDEDQSIYSWRGATVTNIMNFGKDFPHTKTINIEQNYRSAQPILELANQIIIHNKNRNPKKLWSTKKGSNCIALLRCVSEYQEGDVLSIYAQQAQKKDAKKTMAMLYRAHFQSRALEEALIKQSIPYKIIGGVQFYERREVKDILAYLKLVVNPFDRPSFFRIINCPARGLGAKFEEQFYNRWHQEPFLPFTTIAQKCIEEKLIIGTKKTALQAFIKLFDKTTALDKASVMAHDFIRALSYFEHLKNNYEPEEAQERIANIKELINAMQHLESQGIHSLELFLEDVALMQEKQTKEDPNHNPIYLMTLHAAKGLEFDTVILTGLEEGILPSSRSLYDPDALEEERRLAYVGITRAQEHLVISHCRYRYTYGKMSDQMPSRFLDEMASAALPQYDCSYMQSTQIKELCAHLIGSKQARSPVQTFAPAKKDKPAADAPSSKPSAFVKTSADKSADRSADKAPLFKQLQPVYHATFGLGTVKNIETRADGTVIVEVKFKSSTKKIAAQFLEKR